MVNVRPSIPPRDPDEGLKPQPAEGSGGHAGGYSGGGGRFNILLTEDRARPVEHWTRQFPRLMKPLGVEAHLAATGKQALELAERITFHAAFVDLATPKDAASANRTQLTSVNSGGGLWLLEVLQRRADHPPVVVVNSRATRQQAARLLNEALRLGAFSVVNRPNDLHPLLTVIQRLLNRHHQGQWPTLSPGSSPGSQGNNPADQPPD